MELLTVRDTEIVPPEVEIDDLDAVSHLGDDERDFLYADEAVRQLDLTDSKLRSGLIRGIQGGELVLDSAMLDSVKFEGCAFSSVQIGGSARLSRVTFTGCRLLGLRVEDAMLANVMFERCQLDYSLWRKVRATHPVAFVDCSLREASLVDCSFDGAVFDDCRLEQLEIVRGRYDGADFRENDLRTVRGVLNLKKAVVGIGQLGQLGAAVAGELEMKVED